MSAPLRVAIIWHMHQPDYREPGSTSMAFPWVRLHALKDYLDMPLRAAAFPNLRCTFNLVPSLIDQLDAYHMGWDDPHLRLCRLDPEHADQDQRFDILSYMFPGHPPTMFRPFQRYHELHIKYEETRELAERAIHHFTSQELRDLQVWSNLVWIDPIFRHESPVRELIARGRNFTEEDKTRLLDWQHRRLHDVIPTYQRLVQEGKIEVSFTPYYHPILPLLCDTRSALEAVPEMTLPKERFQFSEDAQIQIVRSRELYQKLFGQDLSGMWPSEGSVSEEVLQMFRDQGIRWAATDEEVLGASYRKAGQSYPDHAKFRVHDYQGVKLLFRDHQLSDRVGFVYSGWDPVRAADDFMGHLRDISRLLGDSRSESIVPIILDGENAWEYFPDDGDAFLTEWYQRLNAAHESGEIQLVTASEAIASLPALPLSRIQAGSWINHNFRIWIGHHEDNLAWDLLYQTRTELVNATKTRKDVSADTIFRCWEQIYRAEGSDWFWWFGDEHVGPDNPRFDELFRNHLKAVYHNLSIPIPERLHSPISGRPTPPSSRITEPFGYLSPKIDGRFTTFYEWSGAGEFEMSGTGGAMHRVDSRFHQLRYAFDAHFLYLLVEWRGNPGWKSGTTLRLSVNNTEVSLHHFQNGEWLTKNTSNSSDSQLAACIKEVGEWRIQRMLLPSTQNSKISLSLELEIDGALLERWPGADQLILTIPQRDMAHDWPY